MLSCLLEALRYQRSTSIVNLKKEKQKKPAFIIYDDVESLIEKIDGCKNNAEKSSVTTVGGEHIP